MSWGPPPSGGGGTPPCPSVPPATHTGPDTQQTLGKCLLKEYTHTDTWAHKRSQGMAITCGSFSQPSTPGSIPRIVMAGSSFPSLNRLSLSMWARGSLGLGSLGVPSTRAQRPTVLPQPTMLCRTHVCS